MLIRLLVATLVLIASTATRADALTEARVQCGVGHFIFVVSCPTIHQENPTAPITTSAISTAPVLGAASAAARASYGNLGLRASAAIEAAPEEIGRQFSFIQTRWRDSLTLSSATLPGNTLVAVTMIVETTVTLSSTFPFASGYSDFIGLSTLGLSPLNVACVSVREVLGLGCIAGDGMPHSFRTETTSLFAIDGKVDIATSIGFLSENSSVSVGSISVDSWGSAKTYIRVETPGVTVLSESGHDYSPAPVPEIPVWLSCLLGGVYVIRKVRAAAAGSR